MEVLAASSSAFMESLYPNELHNAGGDCPNPKCNYQLTPLDEQHIKQDKGWFICPKCGMSFNMYAVPQIGGYTRAPGLTPTQMGSIGEQVVADMGTIPGVGKIFEHYGSSLYNNPIDFHIGPYGVEVKTNHSESTPRFRLTGGGAGRTLSEAIQEMIAFCDQRGLIPALMGVRLNFYTDNADIFFKPEMKGAFIGNDTLQHVATVNFKKLNPYKDPEDVPPPDEMPDSSNPDSDIPF